MQSKLTTRRFISDLNNIKGMAKAIPFVFGTTFQNRSAEQVFRNRSVFFGRWVHFPLAMMGAATNRYLPGYYSMLAN